MNAAVNGGARVLFRHWARCGENQKLVLFVTSDRKVEEAEKRVRLYIGERSLLEAGSYGVLCTSSRPGFNFRAHIGAADMVIHDTPTRQLLVTGSR